MLPARLRKQSLRMREDGFATRLSIFPPAILLADRPRSGPGLLTRQISVQSVEHSRPRPVAGLVTEQPPPGLGDQRGVRVAPLIFADTPVPRSMGVHHHHTLLALGV